MTHCRRQTGFTLIELVMVIVLLGTITITVIPRLGDVGTFSVRESAQELVEAIRYAQAMSMSHSGADDYEVTLSGSGYSVTQGGASVSHPLTAAANFSSDWSGVTLSTTGVITFNSRGLPSCSGGLSACSDPGNSAISVTLSSGGRSESVTIESFTGYAHAG